MVLLSALTIFAMATASAAAPQDAPLAPVSTRAVSGVVLDASGAPIAGALVRLDAAGGVSAPYVTGPDGRFHIEAIPGGATTLLVMAPGFAQIARDVPYSATAPFLEVVLQPAPLTETVTVTASRGVEPMATPASTTVLTSSAVLAAGGGMVDDILRNTPGFSLNRRSSSRASPPPSQGVALRGIPGIGASRTLVLADGLSLNDPFGGWVYWNRIPLAAIDRIEVLRGAAGDLYGADAMGGVIQLLTFAPGRSRVRGFFEGGSHQTGRASVFAGTQRGAWTLTAAGEREDTDGFFRVPASDRGSVDRPMTSDYRTGYATLGWTGRHWNAQARVAGYTDRRRRGTVLLFDDTTWRQAAGTVTGAVARGTLQAHVSGGTQEYRDNFSSIPSDRNSERLTTDQRIPATFQAFGGQWTRSWGAHALLVGAEGRHTSATQHETQYSVSGAPSGPFLTGGTEDVSAAFMRTSLAATRRVTVVLGARGDFWRSHAVEAGAPDSQLNVFSPSAAIIWSARPGVTIRTGVSRASRTPTLDELHRGSRQGNVLTNANPQLRPERLTGGEASLLWTGARGNTRVTGFVNALDGMVTNVTIDTTPTLITRQKQNVDRSRASGVEFEGDVRPTRTVTLTAHAIVTSSHFIDAPASSLAGKRVPQMPRYQVGAGVTWTAPQAVTLAAQWRATGAQYDDDQNTLVLKPFQVLDLTVSHPLNRQLHVYVAIENLFDVEYDVGRTPNRTIGLPRTLRGGIRTFLP